MKRGKKAKKTKEAIQKIKPAPLCFCLCKRCDIGYHCGHTPDFQHPKWSDL